MKLHRALLGTTLCAAALAAPASASQGNIDNGFVYRATASDGNALNAACVVRPDRWTADYGPTSIDGVSVFTGPDIVQNDITCSVTFLGNTETVSAYGASPVTEFHNARVGFVGAHITVCVTASASRTLDVQYYAHDCETY